jgi:predicted alpha-1,2-mannosidase
MPVTGTVTSMDPSQYASGFSHQTEIAHPGYYSVDLQNGARAELTATDRTAWERYTFPSGAAGTLLINLADGQNSTTAAHISVVGPHTVEGYQSTGAFCGGNRPVTVYFTAQFDQPMNAAGTWNGSGVSWGTESAQGTDVGAAVRFAPGSTPVVTKIGISYVSLADARANLAAEGKGLTFDAVRNRAHAAWNTMLHRVRVTGGSDAERTDFYTALYHALIEPNLFSDVNGDYVGMDGKIHTAVGRAEYTNLSLWDTYRTQTELLDIVAPTQARDIALSMISDTKEMGWVPRWVLANVETNVMSGDPALPMFADALATGQVTPAELQSVYPLLYDDATEPPPAGNPAVGRVGVQFYRQHGYVPYDPRIYMERSAGSVTLEWALADSDLSQVAATLGHPADAADLATFAHSYRNEFDPSTGFFRPRLADGSWMTPFDPAHNTAPWSDGLGYDEGSAWDYLWLVPQDPADLANLLGGTSAAIDKADQYFQFAQISADPSAAKSLWTGGAHYDPTNEVDLEAPYTYDALGAAWKTAPVVRADLQSVYTPTPAGIPGNDDLGTMSAWYVLSALGLYPYDAGSGVYALTTPLFARAVISTPGSHSARPIVIDAPNAGTDTYVRGLTVNGDAHNSAWISYSNLMGAHLDYTLSSTPDPGWASGPGADGEQG